MGGAKNVRGSDVRTILSLATKICQIRRLPGPPLTKDSAVSLLAAHNVTIGIGIEEPWSARNTRFDIAWVSIRDTFPVLHRFEKTVILTFGLNRPLWKLWGISRVLRHLRWHRLILKSSWDWKSRMNLRISLLWRRVIFLTSRARLSVSYRR